MNLYILGNGGFANEVFDHIFLKNNKYKFSGFITLNSDKAFVISELGINPFSYDPSAAFLLGTNNPIWRTKFTEYFLNIYNPIKTHFPNVYSTRASISYTSTIGIGNLFLPFSSVHGISTIGNFNSFSSYSSVHNRCKIGNYNVVHPYAGIMNQCCIGSNNILQPNSIVTEKLTIGNDNIVSAGECVFDNVDNNELFQSGIILKRIDKGI
jgi:acetyltransferase-like isoleucine patch superfamily enzyme